MEMSQPVRSNLTDTDTIDEHISTTGIWDFIHPKIVAVSEQKFIDGHFADAVESAFKAVNTRVKKIYLSKKGEEKDGTDLMRRTFSSKDPILYFESLNTKTGNSVQQGYKEIFSGAMMGIRNPKAHDNMTITETEAVQRLVFASLLMSKIDEAVRFTGITESE